MDAQKLHWTSMLIQVQQFTWTVFVSLLGARNIAGEYLVFAFIGILVLFGTFIFIRWRRFEYHLGADEIYAVSGGLFKKETHIPYKQIQAVDAKMGLIHRFFNVSQLQIKTASKGTQLDLTAITKEDAKRVRELIELRRGGAIDVEAVSGDDPLLQRRALSTREIIIAAATSKQLFASVAITGVIYDQIGDMFQWEFLTTALGSAKTEAGFDWTLLDPTPFIIVALIAILATIGTIIYTLFLYRSFGVARKSDELSIRSGFTNIAEIDLPIRRIQSVEIKQTPLQLLLGYGQVQIRVIGHSEEKNKNTVLHPCLAESDWQPFLDEFVPGFNIAAEKVRAPIRALPFFMLRSFGLLMLVGLIGVGVLSTFVSLWALSTLLLLIPFSAFAFGIGFSNYWFSSIGRQSNNLTMIVQPWSRTISVIRKDAFQQYFLRQNILQRKLGTATFGVQIASGAIGVTHRVYDLEQQEADRFGEWLGVNRPISDAKNLALGG